MYFQNATYFMQAHIYARICGHIVRVISKKRASLTAKLSELIL